MLRERLNLGHSHWGQLLHEDLRHAGLVAHHHDLIIQVGHQNAAAQLEWQVLQRADAPRYLWQAKEMFGRAKPRGLEAIYVQCVYFPVLCCKLRQVLFVFLLNVKPCLSLSRGLEPHSRPHLARPGCQWDLAASGTPPVFHSPFKRPHSLFAHARGAERHQFGLVAQDLLSKSIEEHRRPVKTSEKQGKR